MAYPSVVTTFTNPLASDRLNSPSHSAIETAQNVDLAAIERFVGTTNASAFGTLIYDIRSPNSDGGGHVQSANKGGTGQTSFIKGDLLVATSSSVLAKFGVGADNLVITADSSQPTGMKWGSVASGGGSGSTAKTLIPISPLLFEPSATTPDATAIFSDNTIMRIGQILIPFGITINTISFNVAATGSSGQVRATLYNESGISSVFSVSTPQLSADTSTIGIVTSPLSSVVLAAGVYYLGLNAVSSVSANLSIWDTDDGTPMNRFRGSVAGKAIIEGVVSILASTPPASITTTAIARAQDNTGIIRLDN